MVNKRLSAYYLGSGDFAVPPGAALAAAREIDLKGVGTQVDRPAGRKRRPESTPVGDWAAEAGLPLDKIPSVNEASFLAKVESLKPDVVVVASFGQILRRPLLELPRLGCVNLHASLLPRHRGASPIAASILAGDEVTGVSVMKMDQGLDTGPVCRRFKLPLSGTETASELEERLGELAAARIVETLLDVAAGRLEASPQDEAAATVTRTIAKRDGTVDWTEDAVLIERKVRAFQSWPGVRFAVETPTRRVGARITRAEVRTDVAGAPGEIARADKREWIVACGGGGLAILGVVPDGKREMSGVEFLRGRPIVEGSRLPGLKKA